jgi:hypothetical protein
MLSKNPLSFDVNVDEILARRDAGAVMIAVSDRYADGRDVSWLWDAPFERLAETGAQITASGSRAADVRLRLKYAGISSQFCTTDLCEALDDLRNRGHAGALYVLCSYSVLLDLSKLGQIPSVA